MKKLTFTLFLIFLFSISFAQKKVACVGNSITAGSYPSFLQKFLGTENYTVANYGLSGHTLMKEGDVPYWNNPKYAEVLAWQPDIVIIKLGTNDAKPQNWGKRAAFEADYREFLASFKNLPSNPEIYVCYPLYAVPDNSLEVKNEYFTEFMIPVINTIAQDNNCKLIDLNTPFTGRHNLIPDGIHPDERGAKYMAQIIAHAICEDCDIPEISFLNVISFDQTDNYVNISSNLNVSENELMKLFDNNADTDLYITDFNTETYIQIELKRLIRLSGYSISAKQNSLKSWKLSASTNGNTWVTLNEQQEQIFNSPDTKIITLSNNVAYRFYRLTFHENQDTSDFSLAEWQLFGYTQPYETSLVNSNNGIITASVDGMGAHESVEKLIDRSINTKFCCVNTERNNIWIKYESSAKAMVAKYTLTSANDVPGRNPRSWKLLASNDGINWDELDSQKDQDFVTYFNTLEYPVSTDKFYTIFKLEIIDFLGDGSQFQLAEWQIFGTYETSFSPYHNQDNVIIYMENNHIHIKSDNTEDINCKIYNISGQCLSDENILSGAEFVKEYSSGIYLISVTTSSGTKISKIIIQKHS